MNYSNNRGPKTSQWLSNMMLRSDDINKIGLATYENMTDMLVTISRQSVVPEVIKGLELEPDTAMTATLKAGAVVSFEGSYLDSEGSWGFVAASGSPFSVWVPVDTQVSFDDGQGQGNPRIDTLEIRPIQQSYDQASRQFKDPITGSVTSALANTRREYDFEFQILKGTAAASPVAPASTAGWIKIAEVSVADGQTVLTHADVVTHHRPNEWTTDTNSVFSQDGAVELSVGLAAKYSMESIEGIDSSGNGAHSGKNLLGPQYKYRFEGTLDNEGKQQLTDGSLGFPGGSSDPVFDNGLNGQAMRFDGGDDYLTMPGPVAGSLVTSSGWSLSVWVRLDTLAGTDGYIVRANELSPAGSITLFWDGSNGAFSANIFDGTTTASVSAPASSGTTDWTHLLLACDGPNLFLYINTELVDETVDTTAGVRPDDGFIGGDGTNGFDGLIDEIKIYFYVLDAEQRNILYGSFDREVEAVDGVAGNAITFKRSDQRFIIENPRVIRVFGVAGVQSLSIWVRTEGGPILGTYDIAFFYREGGNRVYVLRDTVSGELGVSIGDPFEVTTIAEANTYEGDWHHIVLIRDSINQTFSVHYDGELVIDKQSATIPDLFPDSFLIGNGSGGSEHWRGAIDEIRIYERLLSPHEIHALFTDPAGDSSQPETIKTTPYTKTLLDDISAEESRQTLNAKPDVIQLDRCLENVGSPTQDQVFNALDPFIPNVGDRIPVSGGIEGNGSQSGQTWHAINTISHAERDSTNIIQLHYVQLLVYDPGGTGIPSGTYLYSNTNTFSCTSGSSSPVFNGSLSSRMSIAW